MPFKARVFQENVDLQLQGTARDQLALACEEFATLSTQRQKHQCIRGMMEVLDREVDEETRRMIMQGCGRRCIGASTLKRARRLQRESQDLDGLLERLNASHIGGGCLQRVGNVIHAGYDRCYCGSVNTAREPFSNTYCQCSCGWFRQLFETLLERPVEVELLTSILQGDQRCHFLIHIQEAE